MGYPYIHLSYHTRQELKICYGKWEECERDFNRVKSALKEVEGCLETIVLTEDVPVPVAASKVDVRQVDVQPVVGTSESVATS